MDKFDEKIVEIRSFCEKNSDPKIVLKYSKYFKEGYDGYGIDQPIFEEQRDKWTSLWKNFFSLQDYLDLGDKLIASGKFEEAAFAIHFVSSRKDEYSIETFNRIGNWLENGISNWATTDVLCMLVLSTFLKEKVVEPKHFLDWITSPSKWKRRAIPVVFYEGIRFGLEPEIYLSIIEHLMLDEENDVQKGIGTLLRETWKKYPEKTETFLLKWKDTCGRTIIQYATEKMDKEYRLKFRKTKK